MFKDFAAGVEICLSPHGLHCPAPGVPSSMGPELVCRHPFDKENLLLTRKVSRRCWPQGFSQSLQGLPSRLFLIYPPSLPICILHHSAEVVTHPGGGFVLCFCEPFAWGHCQCLSPQDTDPCSFQGCLPLTRLHFLCDTGLRGHLFWIFWILLRSHTNQQSPHQTHKN